MKAIGLKPLYDVPANNNPLPWTTHWLQSKGVQVAPQETEVESYVIGGIKQDIKENAFSNFKLWLGEHAFKSIQATTFFYLFKD